jgi:phospholipid/cholesterol/gamma-HCH transport system substrate-binding protein
VRFPSNVGAAVVPRSIAADRYLEMTPIYSGGPTLADGATVPVERTVTPVDFDRTLTSLKQLSDDLTNNPRATASIAELLEVSESTLRGRGGDINAATSSIADAVAEVNSQRNTVVGTVSSINRLTRTLNANEATVRRFIDNLAAAASLLSDERLNLGASLTSLSASIDDVARLARQNRRALSTDIRGLTRVLRNTAGSQKDLEAVLEALPLAGQNLQLATTEQDRLRLQLDPAALTPLGPFVEQLCNPLGSLCNAIGLLPTPNGLLDQLLALLRGVQQ